MCGEGVRRNHVLVVLVRETSPRCRVFNGWVCSSCYEMLIAWQETEKLSFWPIGTPVLLTGLPDN
jgi:hypothetical protein